MDFFEQQDAARRHTLRLVVYFFLAVALIIVSVYFAALLILFVADAKLGADQVRLSADLWQPGLFLSVTGATVLLVFCGTVYKIMALSDGGESVARMLGGNLLNSATDDPDERKLLNVVEEMAIASGTPVPPVYLIPDESINAFAAGFSPSDAVIGVTKGCMKILDRDELQGVIAHEFSHILNGDMRLNIRLIGVLHGIVLIGLVGFFIIRSVAYSGGRRRTRRRGSGGGGGVVAVLVFGALLVAIGYIGVFFAKLIKSAVSRQREFLADASSVQFTRNPEGISGALKKIGGVSKGSRISSPNAETASHLFFGNALGNSLLGLMASHPPLNDRISRIDPSFSGEFPEVTVPDAGRPSLKDQYPGRAAEEESQYTEEIPGQAILDPEEERFIVAAGAVMEQIGMPDGHHLAYAKRLRNAVPPNLAAAAHEPYGARAVIYGLIFDHDQEIEEKQFRELEKQADPNVFELTQKLLPELQGLPGRLRLPMVDMALPALQGLSDIQYDTFRSNVTCLVEADECVSLFEYALQRILLRHLDVAFKRTRRAPTRLYTLKPVTRECSILLSVLTSLGAETEEEAVETFASSSEKLGLPPGAVTLLPAGECGLAEADSALSKLIALAPAQKRKILDACTTCVLADREVSVEEAELLRAVADSLDCPMPPIFAEPPPSASETHNERP